MKQYTHILFDLDGTLTDPAEGITKSFEYAIKKMGRKVKSREEYREYIGPPIYKTFEEEEGMTKEEAKKAVDMYREYFGTVGLFENALYPEIEECLKVLHEQGKRLFIATSKPTVYAKKIAKHYHIDIYFDEIFGSELDGTRTDKGELIAYILNKLQVEKEKVLMIGDRKHDIIGAQKNGVDSVGVLWGYGGREELEGVKPGQIIDDPIRMQEICGKPLTNHQ